MVIIICPWLCYSEAFKTGLQDKFVNTWIYALEDRDFCKHSLMGILVWIHEDRMTTVLSAQKDCIQKNFKMIKEHYCPLM